MINHMDSVKKKVVYTAIFKDRDEIQRVEKTEGVDYLLFTDNPTLRSDDFKIIVVPSIFDDPVRNAKFYKILPNRVLAKYDCSLWIDASISIEGIDVNVLFERYLKDFDIALHKHPLRNCLYDEAEVCIRNNKDNPAIIREQIENYRLAGYPKQNGLASCGIIYRRHTHKVSLFNEAWWKEIVAHSRRDQLSFNYVVRNSGHEYLTLDGHLRYKEVTGFKLHRHKKRSDFRNW